MAEPERHTGAPDLDGPQILVKTVVVALGGNALTREGQAGTHEEQRANASEMARALAKVLDGGHRVLLTHGNGPQVGNLSIQQEEGAALVPPQPLFVLGGMTQGQIGHMLQMALWRALASRPTPVVSVVTHVLVDEKDLAFSHPTKPIGPFFPRAKALRLAKERGWHVVEDSGRGYRRVVPSPDPRLIVETDAIRTLMDAGCLVIASGGGGIPVVRRGKALEGVEAVIDKDLSAARLASSVGAETLMILTGVDRVALDYGTPAERPVAELTLEEAEGYLEEGQFPAGSMGPKITAAIRFIRAGGDVAIITSPQRAGAALAGTHGTRVVARRAEARTAAGA